MKRRVDTGKDRLQFFEVVYCAPIPDWAEVVLNKSILSIHSNMEREVDAFLATFFGEVIWPAEYAWCKHIIYGSANRDQLLWLGNFEKRFRAEMDNREISHIETEREIMNVPLMEN